MKRALVCLSGGVDSAVAALLLVRSGWDVHAVTFWLWSFPGGPAKTSCCSLDAAALAAQELGVPHQTVDAGQAFQQIILSDYVTRHRRGETPNPCGRCNRQLRFGLALAHAREHGCDIVATGHHVRKVRDVDGRFGLARGLDPTKDQTYFLYGLTQNDLASLEFPIGELTKAQVYAMARQERLTAAELPESQDLCFAVTGDTTYLFREEDVKPGPIRSLSGDILGSHRGLPRYTIGQRRGLGIAADEPLYVVDIDARSNTLVVGPADALLRSHLSASEASFLTGTPPEDGARVTAKIRYRSPAVPATYRAISAEQFELHFDQPQRAVTPGQLAVIYDGDRLLGGGTISRRRSPSGE